MLIWIPLSIILFIATGWFLSSRQIAQIPVFINGLIPSLPNAKSEQECGTTVYVIYTEKDSPEEEEEIYRGYADDEGRVMAMISAKSTGRRVMIKYREDGFESDEFETTIPRHGIIHTVKMEKDKVFNGQHRGKEIADLKKHYEEAMAYAEFQREKYISAFDKVIGFPFARIRVEFWLISYFVLIMACALDYWNNAAAFMNTFSSFTHALCFSVITITTLGYGESYPTTDLIRMACSVEAILGVFLVGFSLNSLFRGPRG